MARLIVVSGAKHRSHGITSAETTIGALGENDLVIDDPEVSKRHARIEQRDDKYFVVDLDSRNGTFVNETKIDEAELHGGDRLRIGTTALFFLEGERLDMSTDGRSAPRPRGDKLGNLLVLQEINKALNSESDLSRLLELIMDTAIHLCDAERGFLVLLNDDKLDFVVARNIDYEVVRSSEFKVSNSVIRKVVKSGEPILTSNAKVDLKSIQSVVSLDVRSLLCVPLRVKSQPPLGTLYLDSRAVSANFDDEDKDLLQSFSDQAAIAIENARLLKEAKEKESILSELRVASRIQVALLPKRDPVVPGLEIAAAMKTAKEVGGDYYDYIPARANMDGSRDLYVAIGDVSGKGVPAGLIMVMARSILRSLASLRDVEPRAVVIETNRILKQDLKPGLFMSLLFLRYDARRGHIRFAGCGHERPIVYRAKTRRVERIELGGLVLGVVADNSKQVAEAEVILEPGDHMLLYTDGVTEAMNPEGRMYSQDRLEGIVAAHGTRPPAELLGALDQDIVRHESGAEHHDDITLIAMRRKPG